jgi:hypothetical protein
MVDSSELVCHLVELGVDAIKIKDHTATFRY